MKSLFIPILSVLFFASNYVSPSNPNITSIRNQGSAANKNIVVVFTKNTSAVQVNKKSVFYTSNNLRYYNNNLLRIDRDLNNANKNDILTIQPDKALLPVDLFYNYVTYNYYFAQGDTIVFTFKNDIPFATCINRKTKPADLNYSLYYKKRFKIPLKESNLITLGKDHIPINRLFEKFNNKYLQQQVFLDSLVKSNALSAGLEALYAKQNEYEFAGSILNNKMLEPYANNFFQQHPIDALINDESLLYNDFFHFFLHYPYLSSDGPNISRIKNGHGISLDYKQAYEKVKTVFSNAKVREYMLFYCLQMIEEQEPVETANKYLSKFKADVKDTIYNAYINKNYALKPLVVPGSSMLTNVLQTKKLDYKDLIKASLNNVIYVDLWASWCLPCRASMPAAFRLKEFYKNKKIKFVYISTDVNFTDWETASHAEGLTNDANSFLLIQPKTAALPKQISLKTIPRYLIYNKKGMLVFANAPGPDSPKLKKILNKYLTE